MDIGERARKLREEIEEIPALLKEWEGRLHGRTWSGGWETISVKPRLCLISHGYSH